MKRLTEEEQERLQRILDQLNSYQAAVEGLRQHIVTLATALTELSITTSAIKTVKGLELDTPVLVPVGSDSFITAKIAAPDKVITGIGADVAAERSADDATKVLETRAAELDRAMQQARAELEKMEERIEALRPEAEQLIAKVKEEPEG